MTEVPGRTAAQVEAARQIRMAGLTLGEAEKVFADAVRRVADAAQQGLEAGLEAGDVERLAFENKNLGSMARAAVFAAVADTARTWERVRDTGATSPGS